MKLKESTELSASANRVWELVKLSGTLVYVSRGLLGFAGAERFPLEWEEGMEVETRLLFLGVLPGWRHRLTFAEVDDARRTLATREEGGPVRRWNHVISVAPLDSQRCRYTDEVEIEAGPFTPFVWLFANIFYRHRQRRWRSLLERTGGLRPET